MTPFVIDANAIHAFQNERIQDVCARASIAISIITESHVIALDVGGLCLQEWIDCAGGSVPFALQDWVNDQLIEGKIVLFELGPNDCKKVLDNAGIPKKDHKWIRLAIGSTGRKLVTDDIDFFDPTKKKADAAVKHRCKMERKGACAKMLERNYSVRVLCYEHIQQEVESLVVS